MTRTDTAAPKLSADKAPDGNRHWPHRGGTLDDLLDATPETGTRPQPGPGEIIARVEAASICSSDIKVIRMGADHPLFSPALIEEGGTVLGHEVCLRVHSVGAGLETRFHLGQRLGLQPAMRVNGQRQIIGMDLPGGFAQYLRLDERALGATPPYVFDVPDTLTAAEIALLEPYGCVERSWQPNVRRTLDPAGRALIVSGEGADTFTASRPLDWVGIACIGPVPDWLASPGKARQVSLSDLGDARFDDIVALGDLPGPTLTELAARLAPGGMLLQARRRPAQDMSSIDPARIHYDALAFVGTDRSDILTALDHGRQRFDARPGGVALVLGAGGAMGRIHVHRLLQLADGPATVVATSRKGQRLEDLRNDFTPLAARLGRRLVVTEDTALEELRDRIAPRGFDDATVIAPSAETVARAARLLAPDGLLSVFAGMPYGGSVPFDLSRIATHGARLTGSTGCSAEDMQGVLQRVTSGEMSLLANVKAVAGLDALPQALSAVTEGRVSGKIVVYPQAPGLPLTDIDDSWSKRDEAALLTQPD